MSSGIAGRCDCPLGRHHAPDCPNYIDVWRSCPCPECVTRRASSDERKAYADYRAGRITRAEWARVMLAEVWRSSVEASPLEQVRQGTHPSVP